LRLTSLRKQLDYLTKAEAGDIGSTDVHTVTAITLLFFSLAEADYSA